MREEIIEFTTIREDFSEYEAENGQILRAKEAVIEIINRIDDGKKKARLKFSIISNVVTPNPIDTSTLELETDPNKVTAEYQVKELSFRPLKEIVNIYETKNAIILLIPIMQKIFLTSKKDANNAPHLRFSLMSDVSIIEKRLPPPATPNF